MGDLSLKGNNKGVLISLIVIVFLLAGGTGYLIWRVNQKDTLAPTDSDASEEICVDRCTGPCTQNPPFEPPDQCTNDSYKGCTGWDGSGEFQGCCTYEHDCEITAYYITYTAGANGTVSNSGQNNVAPGGSISSTATPNSGFKFKQWNDGKTTATRTETNVQADATYTATFEQLPAQTFTLAYSATPYTPGGALGGTLTGNLNQTVEQGNDGTVVTFVGNEGSYCKGSILEWLVDGVKDTVNTGNTRQEKNVQKNMTIVGKTGFVWTTDSTTFRYYTGGHGQLKLGNGTPSINPITLTFTNGQPCPGEILIYAVPSEGYVFSHWNDTLSNTRDTSSLVTSNPRRDIITVSSEYKPNIAVTAIFVPSSGCGDGVCSSSESISTCPIDCPVRCGDAICSEGEDVRTCPSDCPASCGDGICSTGETSTNCPKDCGGNVPKTGIFDYSKTTILGGIILLIIGFSWTSIYSFSQNAINSISLTAERVKEEKLKQTMLNRRERLERKISKRK